MAEHPAVSVKTSPVGPAKLAKTTEAPHVRAITTARASCSGSSSDRAPIDRVDQKQLLLDPDTAFEPSVQHRDTSTGDLAGWEWYQIRAQRALTIDASNGGADGSSDNALTRGAA